MREERFYITDNKYSVNERTSKRILKEDVVLNFSKMSLSSDCKKLKKDDSSETFIKYKAEFKSRIPLSIIIDKNYVNENKKILEVLDRSVREKRISNKSKRLKQLLVAGGFVLAGTLLGAKITSNSNKDSNSIIIDTPNYDDNIIEGPKDEAQQLKEGIEQFNQEQEQKMIEDMTEYRNLDTMPYVEYNPVVSEEINQTKDYYEENEYEEMMKQYRDLDTMPYVEKIH